MKFVRWAVIGVIVIMAAAWLLRPTYPDIITPKPILGNESANVKMFEFSDLQCPACASAHKVVKRILDEYGSSVSLEFRHMPNPMHKDAFDAAVASECANDQGKFWQFVNIAYLNQGSLGKKDLVGYSDILEMDTEAFKDCLDSGSKKGIVNMEKRQGLGMGVKATPTFFVNGKMLESWQYDNFKSVIESFK